MGHLILATGVSYPNKNYKMTGLRPTQAQTYGSRVHVRILGFWILVKRPWEKWPKTGWRLKGAVGKLGKHLLKPLETPKPSQDCSYKLEICPIQKKNKHIENKIPLTYWDFRCGVYINSLRSWTSCPVLLLHLQHLYLWHLATLCQSPGPKGKSLTP